MQPSARKLGRVLVILAVLGAGILINAYASSPGAKDYIQYWTAGQLMVHGGHPYDTNQILALERPQGYMLPDAFTVRNPPYSLFAFAPLGFFSPRAGLALWVALAVGCVIAFIRLLNVQENDRVFAFCFAPVFCSLSAGQSAPLLLLGLSLFLALYQRRPFLAGASLLLVAFKPHLFLIFWAVLAVDTICHKRWSLFAGLGSALILGNAFALHIQRNIWSEYFYSFRSAHLENKFLQTPAYLFRMLVAPAHPSVQMLPSAVAVIWGLWYYWQHRGDWDWRTHGMLVVLVGVVVSPYEWIFDEIVFLPAIMLGLARQRRFALPIFGLISLVVIVLISVEVPLGSGAYLWTSVAWLLWYLYATRRPSPDPVPTEVPQPA